MKAPATHPDAKYQPLYQMMQMREEDQAKPVNFQQKVTIEAPESPEQKEAFKELLKRIYALEMCEQEEMAQPEAPPARKPTKYYRYVLPNRLSTIYEEDENENETQ